MAIEDSVAELGALGAIHALGLDPRGFSLDALRAVLPAGNHPILRWQLPGDVFEDPDALDGYARAELEAAAVLIGEVDRRFRLELRETPGWRPPEWFSDALGTDDRLRLAAVYHHDEPRALPLVWQWPLRVGFLDDPASTYLYDDLAAEQQSRGGWREATLRLLTPAPVPAGAGLILVPSLAEARPRLEAAGDRLRCGALLLLDWDREPETAIRATADLLRSTWASGVLFAGAPQDRTHDFFFADSASGLTSLARELTHNFTIDAATVTACREHGFDYPYLTGSTALMRDSRLSRVMGRMRRSMESPRASRVERDRDVIQPPMRGAKAAPDMPYDAAYVEIEEPHYYHEGDYSVGMAEFGDEMAASMAAAGAEPETGGPRFLQTRVTPGGGEPVSDFFRPGARLRAEVLIGVPRPGWLQPSGEVPFPDDELPPELDEYALTVAFAVLGAPADAPLPTRRIRLPRGKGDSTPCAFDFEVPDDAERFEARILVLFRNRILQTGLLTGPVGRPADGGQISFEIEALVSRYFSGLEDRTRFAHALLFNRNGDGTTGVTTAAGGEVRFTAPEGLAEQLDQLNNLVSSMAYEPDEFTGKLAQNPTLLKYMIAFARDGADLRDLLERQVPPESGFDSRKPIQILTKALGDKIPVEFFYDYEAPAREATLCPNAAASLTNKDGTCDRKHNRTVFCPSGFWGLSRVIERHEYSPESSAEEFVLRNEPTATRRAIAIRNRALFAGTQEVDKALGQDAGLIKIKTKLDALTERRCRQVATWEDWETTVGSDAPGVLVLLVHTDYDPPPFREQKLEIGDDRWLFYNDIRPAVVAANADPGPLLFLIGCKTGEAKIRYKTLSEKFKRGGASLIVGSNATIHAQHAVPMLEKLIDKLRENVVNGPVPFGEVMRDVRREMLAAGIPIILCITAYGDADWNLT